MIKKIGVYLCSGCEIGESINTAGLAKVAAGEDKVTQCQIHPFLCGEEGAAMIHQDLQSGLVNRVVVAACSGRFNYQTFDFGPLVPVERVALREQVAWSQEPQHPDTQAMAEDAIRMSMARAKSTDTPVPLASDISRKILVVGGGLSGMTAALEAARAGYPVVMVEKEETLGGWIRRCYKLPPIQPPYTDPQDNRCLEKIAEVEAQSNIQVYLSAVIDKTAGSPGLFDVAIKQGDKIVVERVGSIIQASGARPYDSSRLTHLGHGMSPDVITRDQLEDILASRVLVRPSDGKPIQKAAFIQCAGSRDAQHLPYCSSFCCLESIKQALCIKFQNPDAELIVFYQDIYAPGPYERFYKQAQSEGIIFIKADVERVVTNDDGLSVEVNDLLMGSPALVDQLDIVVLVNGLEAGTPLHHSESVLNLGDYVGSELPLNANGFPDSSFNCFPYETQRTGIYAAGSVRAPMGIIQAVEDATGAAMKAIQCIEMMNQGMALHPRSGDLSYPEFQMGRCTQCKRCIEECPFGAINGDETSNPVFNPTRCRRCGICMGACPERIISFQNYSVPMVCNMVKAIHVPEEEEEKPRILVFACENDAVPAIEMAGINRIQCSPWIRIIPVRCLGSLNLIWINDAMSRGIDGVLLLGCKHGDDYQCHFMKGSELAGIRLFNISETLDRLGLESERVAMVEINIMDYHRIPQIIQDFVETISRIGPNPMKGL